MFYTTTSKSELKCHQKKYSELENITLKSKDQMFLHKNF